MELNKNGNYLEYLRKSRADIEIELNSDIDVLARHEERLNELVARHGKYKKAIPIISKVLELYSSLDAKDKNELLKSLIKRIEFKRIGAKPSDFELKIMLII